MSKLLGRNLEVESGRGGMPLSFKWRNRSHKVREIQDFWRQTGAWWDGEGETTFFRVCTVFGGIYDLGYNHLKKCWTLSEVED